MDSKIKWHTLRATITFLKIENIYIFKVFTELLGTKGSVIPSLDDAAVWNSTLILASISTRHIPFTKTLCEQCSLYLQHCGNKFARRAKPLATSGRLPRLLKHALAAATWYQMLYTNPLREQTNNREENWRLSIQASRPYHGFFKIVVCSRGRSRDLHRSD